MFSEAFEKAMTQGPGIYIPYVSKNVRRIDIYDVFNRMNIGVINTIDMVPHHNKDAYYVFIVFVKWTDINIRQKIMNGQELKLVYNTQNKWFWLIRKMKTPIKQDTSHYYLDVPYIDYDYIVPVPKTIRGVSIRHNKPPISCPECEYESSDTCYKIDLLYYLKFFF